MSVVVNTNISSIVVQRSLSNATDGVNKSIERMSTGYRINHAADDAAGLVISEGLEAQVNGSNQAIDNAETGINLLQTAEGDLSVIQDNLQRIRDLTVQAANGTYGTSERTAIRDEVDERMSEINRIAQSSSFNKINLLDGSGTSITLQIGADSGTSTNTLDIGGALSSAFATALGVDTVTSTAFSTNLSASSFISEIDDAISSVSTKRSRIGSIQNRLNSTIESLSIRSENLESANSRIRDTDVADEAANLTKQQILQQASGSLLTQANQSPSIALSLI